MREFLSHGFRDPRVAAPQLLILLRFRTWACKEKTKFSVLNAHEYCSKEIKRLDFPLVQERRLL